MRTSTKTIFGSDFTGVLVLGLCPAIAVSVRVIDALWMSAGVILVMVFSGLAMAFLARGAARPSSTQTAAEGLFPALVISSILTAALESALLALAPSASASLGIYAPLIAVNCLVLNTGASGLTRPSLGRSVSTAVGRGLGFATCLLLIALVRETIGAGTITLFPTGTFGGTIVIPRLGTEPVRALGFAGGGLLCLGYLAGAVRAISSRAGAGSSQGESSR